MDAGYSPGGGFRHEAAFYRTPADYRAAVLPFVREGLDRREAVLVAVPGAVARVVRESLDGQSADVAFADMERLGRNPGRVISAVWEFADRHAGHPVRFVNEVFWPGRSAAEIREATTHEALVNMAFAASPSPVALLCPYDIARLTPEVTASAGRTHPVVRTPDGARPSAAYAADAGPLAGGDPVGGDPLPPAPGAAQCLAFTTDLKSVRALVAAHARRAGLAADRTADLALAVGEVAANTVRHTPAAGTVRVWHTGDEVVCQVSDQGRIGDPLVGRRRPPGTGGLGLWVVHQICDLVELRSGPDGTTVRMHMLLQ